MNAVWDGLEFPAAVAKVYHGRNILITGGRGYLGAALAESLADVDCNLVLLDRSSADVWKPHQKRATVSFLQGDVSLRQTWEAALPNTDHIFHLAGLEYIHRAHYDAAHDLRVTALSVLHLLEVCQSQSYTPTIIFSSSANLFGKALAQPVSEDTADDPLTLWAVYKLMAEHTLRIYALEHGTRSITLRFANIYGPTPRGDLMNRVVLNGIISRAMSGENLVLYSNRDCLRDYLYIDDAVRALLLAGTENERLSSGQYYVIGSGDALTIAEVWQLIGEQTRTHSGREVCIRVDDSINVGTSEIRDFIPDSTRFLEATGWKPQVGLSEGILLTLKALANTAA